MVRPAGMGLACSAPGAVAYRRRTIDFNRLMGTYIFFVVSRRAWTFGERPATPLLIGGALIAAGGVVIQPAAP
jgi:hypothetical protein